MGKALREGALVEPVRVEVIPPGVTLDRLAEIRARKLNKGQRPKRGQLGSENTVRAKPSNAESQAPPKPDVFDFINTRLAGASASAPSPGHSLPLRQDAKAKGAKKDPKALQRELFDCQVCWRRF